MTPLVDRNGSKSSVEVAEMKRWMTICVVGVLLFGTMGLVASADVTSSILEPISPVDQYQANTGARPVIVTDNTGAMMLVFKATNPADNQVQLCSLLRSGSTTKLAVIAQGLSEFYGKAAGAAFSIGLGVLNQASPIQRVQQYRQGTVDPNELHDAGTVGTYVSWFGTDYSSVYSSGPGLFDLAQANLPIAGQWAGGWTRVRMDKVELSDGQNGDKVVWKQWWSPKAGIYPINAPFTIDDLLVRIYVKVHNQDQVPIWGCAKNIITWKPSTGELMMVSDPAYPETPTATDY
jgi:hypothetical protein